MFYKQVILQRGLPFEVKLPEHPLDVSRMTAEKLDTELEKGYTQMKAGQTIRQSRRLTSCGENWAYEL